MSVAQNHLIELLPRNARSRLLSICEPVYLVMSDVLSNSGDPTRQPVADLAMPVLLDVGPQFGDGRPQTRHCVRASLGRAES